MTCESNDGRMTVIKQPKMFENNGGDTTTKFRFPKCTKSAIRRMPELTTTNTKHNCSKNSEFKLRRMSEFAHISNAANINTLHTTATAVHQIIPSTESKKLWNF